ncbi:MFS general substrate transporter [Athelia psychrophila]|uniref:MFS general substrate transporter n=1 Tax=Athelia psychrophila TaxID=1759441 RepID=A0A165XD07_9AGAM|nr:MFS general substrate transporter [Fibularhizoctonia sp. CBS 109695]
MISSTSTPLSPAETMVDGYFPFAEPLPEFPLKETASVTISPARKYILFTTFCLAQFLDNFNNSALFSAIPSLIIDLGITEGQSTWIMSAFQLTFAAFLLVSGRISDVYNPKFAFIAGIGGLGVISLGAGFARDKILLIVLRAFSGIAASLTIPSALSLIVTLFPEPEAQARALSAFGGSGSVGNVMGLFVGAIFIQYASWHWTFWFLALLTVPIASVGLLLIPREKAPCEGPKLEGFAKFKSLDLIGVSTLTTALVLLIFSLTSGSSSGWTSPLVLAPLIISVIMIVAFFIWEKHIPKETAAIPPHTWFYPNFAVLFSVALMPYLWWTTMFTMYITLWQEVYHWSALKTAAHMLPLGVLAFVVSMTGGFSRLISPKWIILTGQVLAIVASFLLSFANGPDKYWRFVLPGFLLGTAGNQLMYTHTNIAIFKATPPAVAGTIGAIFNGALQLGSAIGLAACSSIETSVEATHGGFDKYYGRAAVFYFFMGVIGVQALGVLVFYRVQPSGDALEVQTPLAGPTENRGLAVLMQRGCGMGGTEGSNQ